MRITMASISLGKPSRGWSSITARFSIPREIRPRAMRRGACRWRSSNTTPGRTSNWRPMPSGEAQAAAVADDIAYNAHDIDDGLRAGLFDIEALREVAFLDELLQEVDAPLPRSRSLPPHPRAGAAGHYPLRRGCGGGGRAAAGSLAPASAEAIRQAASTTIWVLAEKCRQPMRRSKDSSTRTCTATRT